MRSLPTFQTSTVNWVVDTSNYHLVFKDSKDCMRLGRSIKLCRTQRGISQSDLARAAGVSASYMSLLEKEKRDPPLSTLEDIAAALRVPLSVLIFLGADDSEISGLPPEARDCLSSIALDLIRS